jgi:hypothetical protein
MKKQDTKSKTTQSMKKAATPTMKRKTTQSMKKAAATPSMKRKTTQSKKKAATTSMKRAAQSMKKAATTSMKVEYAPLDVSNGLLIVHVKADNKNPPCCRRFGIDFKAKFFVSKTTGKMEAKWEPDLAGLVMRSPSAKAKRTIEKLKVMVTKKEATEAKEKEAKKEAKKQRR